MNGNLLMAEIKLHGYTMNDFLLKIQMPRSTWSKKMRGMSEFTRAEMIKIINALQLSPEQIMAIFFCVKVS